MQACGPARALTPSFSFYAITALDSFGFEMETFEFLNILQVHGFPKVMCVLTHLDRFDNVKALRATKKKLKTRFWTEVGIAVASVD